MQTGQNVGKNEVQLSIYYRLLGCFSDENTIPYLTVDRSQQ